MKYFIYPILISLIGLDLQAQDVIEPLSDKQVTIELLLVEYIHRDGFNWGINILNAQKGKFGESSFSPGNESGILSLDYDITGKLNEKFKLNLQSLVENNEASILQNPRVTVQNTKTGKININEDKYIQLQTSSINGLTTHLQKIQAGVSLEIKPTIMSDSLLNLKVVGSISEFQIISETGGDYSVETNKIDTDVTMKNNKTLVIGGMIKKENDYYENGVIFLKKIPLIGKLFSRIEKRVIQKEMVLYLTANFHDPINGIKYENKLLKEDTNGIFNYN